MAKSSFDPLGTLKEYLRHPSVSTDPAFAEGMAGTSTYITGVLEGLGFSVDLVPTALHPVVYAKREAPAGSPHVILYGHYDVQPPDPLDLWESEPFDPVEKNGRLYARGSADNKGPFIAHVAGLAQALAEHPDLPVRITIILEGEEEIGSPNLADFIKAHRAELADADFILLSDTCSPNRDQIVVTTGLRGLVGIHLTLHGPASDLHSGLFGGPVLNPVIALSSLLGRVHGPDGRVQIPGFYDGVLDPSPWDREQIEGLGLSDQELARLAGTDALRKEEGFSPLEQIRLRPTFEVNGMYGGYIGQGNKTIIPSKAHVKITCRLVPDQDPLKVRNAVISWFESQIPPGTRLEIAPPKHSGGGGRPYGVLPPQAPESPIAADSPLGRAFVVCGEAIEEETGNPALYLREGGSIPIIAEFKRILGLDSLMIGLFTPEDGLHAPNESLDLTLFQRGIAVSREIWKSVGGVRPTN